MRVGWVLQGRPCTARRRAVDATVVRDGAWRPTPSPAWRGDQHAHLIPARQTAMVAVAGALYRPPRKFDGNRSSHSVRALVWRVHALKPVRSSCRTWRNSDRRLSAVTTARLCSARSTRLIRAPGASFLAMLCKSDFSCESSKGAKRNGQIFLRVFLPLLQQPRLQ
jgi:hypothetical protein